MVLDILTRSVQKRLKRILGVAEIGARGEVEVCHIEPRAAGLLVDPVQLIGDAVDSFRTEAPAEDADGVAERTVEGTAARHRYRCPVQAWSARKQRRIEGVV